MIRSIIRVIICGFMLLTGVGLVGCESESESFPKLATTDLPMKVANGYWPGTYWLAIATEKGWFKEAGLNVEFIDISADYIGSLQATVDGGIDSNNFTLFDMMRFNLAGSDLVMVFNADNSIGSEAIVSTPEIKTINELRGKTIGVDQGSYLEYILGIALGRKGISLSEVKLVNMDGEATIGPLEKAEVDAIITWEPMVSQAVNGGYGRKLFDTSQVDGISPSGPVFSRNFIEERENDVQAFVNVWHKSTQYLMENPKEAFAIVGSTYGVTPAEAQAFVQVDKILNLSANLEVFTFGSGHESLHGGIQKLNQFFVDQGVTDKSIDSTKYLDARFIRALDK